MFGEIYFQQPYQRQPQRFASTPYYTDGAATAAMAEKVWGEYVLVVCQILAKRNTKMSEAWANEFKVYFN